jgi:ATP-dependent Clp protease ATP-binding subunit ClpC
MVLIVMTSNLGAAEAAPVGFGEDRGGDYVRSVRQHFRPEFFNRIDQVVPFRNLAPADIERIVDLELEKLSTRAGLVRRKLRLDVHPDARRLLARLGFHPTRGARPLKRVIEEQVITPVAVRMASEPELKERVIRVLAEESPELLAIPADLRSEVVTVSSSPETRALD